MGRKTQQELQQLIALARTQVPVGVYRHDESGAYYVVTGHELHEPTVEPHVSYMGMGEDYIPWSRPVDVFVKKFTRVGDLRLED